MKGRKKEKKREEMRGGKGGRRGRGTKGRERGREGVLYSIVAHTRGTGTGTGGKSALSLCRVVCYVFKTIYNVILLTTYC